MLDMRQVFDVVWSLWMKDLVAAEHSWVHGAQRGCLCYDTVPEGSASAESHEQEDPDDIYVPPCDIEHSIDELMLALGKRVEPEIFKQRVRALRDSEEDGDSETVYDPNEDRETEMAE